MRQSVEDTAEDSVRNPSFILEPVATPGELYTALKAHDNEPIIVDFDETLWLRNSTEEFLQSVRPRFLAAVILQLIGMIRPWRLSGRRNVDHRDWWRISAVVFIAPWSIFMWRKQASELGRRFQNTALLRALRDQGLERVAVVTYGFDFIVRPLLRSMDERLQLAVAATVAGAGRLRRRGKAAAFAAARGQDALRRSLVITDSRLDADLLSACARPFLIQWPDAEYRPAGLRPLMPFVYLVRVKRPDESYFRRGVLGHDFAVAFLCFVLPNPDPVAATVSLFVFLLAFFSAYEIGYFENDRLGARHEEKPKISKEFWTLGQNFSPGFAWFCALVLAAAASVVGASASWLPARFGLSGWDAVAALWGAFVLLLLTVRGLFHLFNNIEPKRRIAPMLALQVLRVLGYGVIFATSVAGALFCISHALARWVPYVVYRFGGDRRDVPAHIVCFLVFSSLVVALAISGEATEAFWHTGLLLGYAFVRAVKDALRHLRLEPPLRAAVARLRLRVWEGPKIGLAVAAFVCSTMLGLRLCAFALDNLSRPSPLLGT